ncbi:MAG: Asp-tRNA(Asn)/Glu-tRNA(Gln) amidotransferase GatCAB subunit A [Acidobacteria bacterium]|nr:MAG: Asp-tRNA(Asn)/Glu-tRNA(Gln) amidotransferase GatCAB subunit A [Acidobacteriota bacterium]
MNVPFESETICPIRRAHFSRRSFVKTALAVTAGFLAESGSAPATQYVNSSGGPPNRSQTSELTNLSIDAAGRLVRLRKLSPVELTNACLAQIEKLNPVLNAFITVTADSAATEARMAEAEIRRGKWRGPVHGIPIALKDLFDTAGVRTTAGSGVFKDRIPAQDAEVVRRLKAAGAIFLGKTNLHEFAFGGSSLVTYFGGVHNPWEHGHIAGGSSGGSAAAVAGGLCYGALGSDTAGSIRQPAAYCGIVGLKPTFGLVSTRGVIPLSWSLDHVGPMARSVADTALILQVIAGYDPEDTASVSMTVPDYAAALRKGTETLRLGIAREFFFEGLDPEIERATNQALAVLEKLTAGIRDVAISAGTQEQLRSTVRLAEAYAYHAKMIATSPEQYQPETLARLRPGADVDTVTYIQARRELAHTRRTIGQIFQTVDALITPTSPILPPAITEFSGDRNGSLDFVNRNIRNTSPFDVYGWPTISVPCGFSASGLPIGLQISAGPGQDVVVLQIAHAYEQATNWHTRRPGPIG